MARHPLKNILILGGTAEASQLAELLAEDGRFRVITSLAGRTAAPVLPRGECHLGGFGGVDGLLRYLAAEQIDLIVDATHPFAIRISAHAAESAARSEVPCIRLARPAWPQKAGDHWIIVRNEAEAAGALPPGACVFLALGRQYLQSFAGRNDITLVIRMVDPPESLPMENATVILGKPTSSAGEERALFAQHGISHLVARNSGGQAGYGKIEAARDLSLPVIIIARPAPAPGDTVASAGEAFSWITGAV